MINAPLFAKTTTFAASSAVLARLPARDAGWLRQAAATQATTATDRARWASACSQGLKPLAVTQQQFTALHAAEAATYGSLATQEPRMDNWAACHGPGVGASPTRVLDGTCGVPATRQKSSFSVTAQTAARPAVTGWPFITGVTRCTTQ